MHGPTRSRPRFGHFRFLHDRDAVLRWFRGFSLNRPGFDIVDPQFEGTGAGLDYDSQVRNGRSPSATELWANGFEAALAEENHRARPGCSTEEPHGGERPIERSARGISQALLKEAFAIHSSDDLSGTVSWTEFTRRLAPESDARFGTGLSSDFGERRYRFLFSAQSSSGEGIRATPLPEDNWPALEADPVIIRRAAFRSRHQLLSCRIAVISCKKTHRH